MPPKKTHVTNVMNYFNNRIAILVKSGDIKRIHDEYGIKHTSH